MNTQLIRKQEYYNALVDKNTEYKMTFYACVKTTKIYCLSTCTARKPKFENVMFVDQNLKPEELGYRACKVCKPLKK